MVPGLTGRSPEYLFRLVAAGIVKACRMDDEDIRHGWKCQKDRRTAGRAEGVRLDRSEIADDVPMLCLARHLDGCAGEGQVGSVSGPAPVLALAALAVVHRHRLTGDFIMDRAAGASTGKGVAHVCLLA